MAHSCDLPIGLFDSGLGGLTVLRALRELLPAENLVYLGDTARTPYGSKSPSTITRYAAECAGFLRQRQTKLLVVACNTASSYALNTLQTHSDCPVVGTIEPVIAELRRQQRTGPIAVLGTQATIDSGAYQSRIAEELPGAEAIGIACPLFVPLVEQGMVAGEIVEKIIALYLAPLRAAGVKTVVLGCTHYPLLRQEIQRYLGTDAMLIECSVAVAREVQETLTRLELNAGSSRVGEEQYFVTDEASRFNSLAQALLSSERVESIKVESLQETVLPCATATALHDLA